ncbi:MAG: DUF3783 domain-containing protein [Anaerovoracaceae bacterium]|jgi:hypothetical protein
MTAKVWLYRLPPEEDKGRRLRALLEAEEIAFGELTEEDAGKKIGDLIEEEITGDGPDEEAGASDAAAPDEEFLLLSGLEDDALDHLLEEMKKAGVSVGCKAVVTSSNVEYRLGDLIESVAREHQMMTTFSLLKQEMNQALMALISSKTDPESKAKLKAAVEQAAAALESGSDDPEVYETALRDLRAAM